VPIVLKSGSLNLLEPSGPVQGCNGIALPWHLPAMKVWEEWNTDDTFVHPLRLHSIDCIRSTLRFGLV